MFERSSLRLYTQGFMSELAACAGAPYKSSAGRRALFQADAFNTAHTVKCPPWKCIALSVRAHVDVLVCERVVIANKHLCVQLQFGKAQVSVVRSAQTMCESACFRAYLRVCASV